MFLFYLRCKFCCSSFVLNLFCIKEFHIIVYRFEFKVSAISSIDLTMAEGGYNRQNSEGHDNIIISDVIQGVRQSFIDSGVPTEVLEKLQQLWISKLEASPSQGLSVKDVRIHPRGSRKKGGDCTSGPELDDNFIELAGAGPSQASKKNEKIEELVEGPVTISSGSDEEQKVTERQPIVLSSDSDDDFKDVLEPRKLKLIKAGTIPQVDGPADSSDEEEVDEDEEDDDDDDDDDDNDPDGDEEDEGVEEEPLGSEDDISDEDASDLFDTENVVVCQYDKITRARNKWKFHLKV